jgi:hypothetical protein
MRFVASVVAALVAALAAGLSGASQVPAAAAAPVVVELFTSEGCSSCPPADALLRVLGREPVGGVTVLVLGEHVDYWDQLGWRDRFASAAFSRRQSEYATTVFGADKIYTPQIVIDGHLEGVGSNEEAVRAMILAAAREPKGTVTLNVTRDEGRGDIVADVSVSFPATFASRGDADVLVAVTEDHLETDVRSGENRARRLVHSGVVHKLTVIGTVERTARGFNGYTRVAWAAAWKPADVQVVAFVQERRSRRIIAAGSARF